METVSKKMVGNTRVTCKQNESNTFTKGILHLFYDITGILTQPRPELRTFFVCKCKTKYNNTYQVYGYTCNIDHGKCG